MVSLMVFDQWSNNIIIGVWHTTKPGMNPVPGVHLFGLTIWWSPVSRARFRSKLYLGWNFLTYNHGQKCWDSYTVRTLFNAREIVAACYKHSTSLPCPPTPGAMLKPWRHNSCDVSTLYWVGKGEGTCISNMTALFFFCDNTCERHIIEVTLWLSQGLLSMIVGEFSISFVS